MGSQPGRDWSGAEPNVHLRLGDGDVAQDLFVHELRPAVRVGRPRGEALIHRHTGGVSIHGGRGREDDVAASRLRHDLEQREGALHVHLVVQLRLRHALAHRLEPSEVYHRAHVVLREHGRHRFLVADVGLVKRGLASGELLHALQALEVGVAQVVHDDHLVVGAQQLQHSVAADVAHAARHEHLLSGGAAAQGGQCAQTAGGARQGHPTSGAGQGQASHSA